MLKLTKYNIEIKQLPCHQCITLSICKSQLSHCGRPPVFITFLYSETSKLSEKCSLISDYMRPYDYYDYNIYHRRLAVHYLTGIDMGGDMPSTTYSMKELYQKLNMIEEYKHDEGYNGP